MEEARGGSREQLDHKEPASPVRAFGTHPLGEKLSMVPSQALMGSAPLSELFKVREATVEEKYLRLACCFRERVKTN